MRRGWWRFWLGIEPDGPAELQPIDYPDGRRARDSREIVAMLRLADRAEEVPDVIDRITHELGDAIDIGDFAAYGTGLARGMNLGEMKSAEALAHGALPGNRAERRAAAQAIRRARARAA